MIPIVRQYEGRGVSIKGFSWRQEELHSFNLCYNDKPILTAKKIFGKRVIEHKNSEGRITSRSLVDDTYFDIFDMEGNKLDSPRIKIYYAHNRQEDELPQLESVACVQSMIRQAKINQII